MLVLTMKVGKKVMIGDDIEVQILKMAGGQVKVGFTAPTDVEVDRLEVWQRKRDERERRRKRG
jgi:carbon storage regulator